MNILVINCGSSSLSFRIYSVDKTNEVQTIASGKARNVGTLTREKPHIDYMVNGESHSVEMDLQTHRQAARECIKIIQQNHHRH